MVDMAVTAIIGKSMNSLRWMNLTIAAWALSVSKIAAFIVIPIAEQSAIGLTL
jgi:hypothetical protein